MAIECKRLHFSGFRIILPLISIKFGILYRLTQHFKIHILMNTSIETRYASSPQEAKTWDTAQSREALLITPLFIEDQVKLVYSHYDRFITGGIMPVKQSIQLGTVDPLKAEYFLERRE